MTFGKNPHRLLVLAANPLQSHQLRLDKEVRDIQNGLRGARLEFEIKQQWAIRPIDIRRAMLDYRPTFVHFCGHGEGESGIVLEDDEGASHLVNAEALAGLFSLFPDVRCVLLNACYSVAQAEAIARHIDCVIGMDQAIEDRTAIEFAVAFYDALGAGESIDFAHKLGCNAIQLAGLPDYMAPVLLRKSTVVALPRPASTEKKITAYREDWGDAPDVEIFFGREKEIDTLEDWIFNEKCRLILIIGLGGSGKTSLSMKLGRGGVGKTDLAVKLGREISQNFNCIIWRKLLNAPPPEEIFRNILELLTEDCGLTPSQLPLPVYISSILKYLQRYRCLVILDNFESILQPGNSGMRYREGYEAYGELLLQVGKIAHQSCIVLTSREKPREVAEMEGVRRPVRSFQLGGLSAKDGRRIFEEIGTFSGNESDWERVTDLYHGNPLALELAARHINEVFLGSLPAFLQRGRTIFIGLQELLDWHINRLSEREMEIIYWLAIEREPVSIDELQENLVSPIAREQIFTTLQTLQRRLPLDKSTTQFTLQPVLIEHMTTRLIDQIGEEFRISHSEILKEISRRLADSVGREIEASSINLLNTYALVKAMAKEHVRESQSLLILEPIRERLLMALGSPLSLIKRLFGLLNLWRQGQPMTPGYAAGNILNLLRHLGADLRGGDFSHLRIWQAHLQGANLQGSNFSGSEFQKSSFTQNFGNILCLCFSPGGDSLAAGDDNNDVRVWRISDGQLLHWCRGHASFVNTVGFSPDGEIIVSGSIDHAVRMWSSRDGHCLNVLEGHTDWVNSACFSPDGALLASGSEDHTVRLWDPHKGTFIGLVDDHEGSIASVAFSPNGQLLVCGSSEGLIKIYRRQDFKLQEVLTGYSGKCAVAFSSDSKLLASSGESFSVQIWRAGENSPILSLRGHSNWVRSVAFGPRGDIVVSASDDQTVRVWDLKNGRCISTLQGFGSRVWSVCFHPSGDIFATGSDDQTVRIWSADDGKCISTLQGYCNRFWSVAFGPSQDLLVSGSEDHTVRIWDTHTGECQGELRGHSSRIWAVDYSSNGRWVASAGDDLTIILWDIEKRVAVHILRGHADWIRTLAFKADSQTIASGSEDNTVRIWAVEEGRCIAVLTGHTNRVLSVAFSPVGEWLASGSEDYSIRIWACLGGDCVQVLCGHSDKVRSVSFDPTGSRLVSSSEDGTLKIWDLQSSQCLQSLVVGNKVWASAISPNGELIASGSEDGLVRLWKFRESSCLAILAGHESRIWSVGFSADSRTLASGADDGTIRTWDLTSRSPLRILRVPKPYESMDITGASGLTLAQIATLKSLGAVERVAITGAT